MGEEVKKLAHEDQEEEAKEPDAKKQKGESYYQEIDGKKLDGKVIDTVREAVDGKGDGRVSVDDCKNVLDAVLDAGKITATERWTLRYSVTEFKWTEAALDHLKTSLDEAKDKNE